MIDAHCRYSFPVNVSPLNHVFLSGVVLTALIFTALTVTCSSEKTRQGKGVCEEFMTLFSSLGSRFDVFSSSEEGDARVNGENHLKRERKNESTRITRFDSNYFKFEHHLG